MLVGGSEAGALLAAMFTREQQPHLAFATAIAPIADGIQSNNNGHRRRRKLAEGSSAANTDAAHAEHTVDAAISAIRVSLRATAPTPGEAAAALDQMQLAGAGRRLLAADGAREQGQEQGGCDEAEAALAASEAALAASEAALAALEAALAASEVALAASEAQVADMLVAGQDLDQGQQDEVRPRDPPHRPRADPIRSAQLSLRPPAAG
jgi:hypothetical protein